MSQEFDPVLITGAAHPKLAEAVGKYLGLPVHHPISRFADGEAKIEIKTVNMRKREVFIIQPTCPPNVDGNYMELFGIIDAARRGSAAEITAVIPYFGYSRQERKDKPRVPIMTSLLARFLQEAGAKKIMTVDIHAAPSQGFFDDSWDDLPANYCLIPEIKKLHLPNVMFGGPDEGSIKRVTRSCELYGVPKKIAIISKEHDENQDNKTHILTMTGDVKGRNVYLVDDMVDTAGTLINAADYMYKQGAESIRAVIAHGLFSNKRGTKDIIKRIEDSALQQIFITDTIPQRDEVLACPKITVVSVAQMLAEGIQTVLTGGSIKDKFYSNGSLSPSLANAF